MPMPLQATLLRVLQERRITRVGGAGEIEVDVRVIAASNRDLPELVAEGGFREDLYYRLNVVPVELPPLRDRRDDIPLLAAAFLERAAARHGRSIGALTPAIIRRLMDYHWPGNVRELSNAIERLVLLAENEVLDVEDLPPAIRGSDGGAPAPVRLPAAGLDWEAMEESLLRQALDRTGGNRAAAARLLGLGYKAFLYRLDKHRLGDGD